MKKFSWSDFVNEISFLGVLLSSFVAVTTFGISTPLFIVSLIAGVASIGGIVGSAAYNKKKIKEKNKALEEKETKEIENLAELKNCNQELYSMNYDEIKNDKIEKLEKENKKNR